MAELLLQPMDGNAIFQLVRGVGMTQAMDTPDFVDTGNRFGPCKHLLRRGDTQMKTWGIRIRKQPGVWTVTPPVVSQLIQ